MKLALKTVSMPSTALSIPAADLVRYGDTLNLALALAQIAIDLAEQRGGAARTIAQLRTQLRRLRASI